MVAAGADMRPVPPVEARPVPVPNSRAPPVGKPLTEKDALKLLKNKKGAARSVATAAAHDLSARVIAAGRSNNLRRTLLTILAEKAITTKVLPSTSCR